MSSLLPLLVALSIASSGPVEPVLMIDEVEFLQDLEAQGLSLAARLGAPKSNHTADLAKHSSWSDVVDVLGEDLDRIMRADDRAGPGLER